MKKMNRQVRLLMRNGLKATITFWPRKVKMYIIEETKNGRHMLGNTEKRLVIILMNQFQILLAHFKCVQTCLWISLIGTIWSCDAERRWQVKLGIEVSRSQQKEMKNQYQELWICNDITGYCVSTGGISIIKILSSIFFDIISNLKHF